MITVKMNIAKADIGYEYPIPVADIKPLYYADDYSYVIAKVPDQYADTEGVSIFRGSLPAPAPSVPEFITPRQGYIILSRYGLLAPVKAYFAALEGQEGEEAKIELEFAQEWKRSWPTLINAAHAFGLTDAQIDQMFIEASVI